MKGKTLLILLVATGILVGLAALRFGGGENSADVKMGAKLFVDLPVNAVAKVVIADAAGQVTLVKGDAYWQVQERSGYPADFDKLRDVVVKLSRLKIGRSFSGTPESLTRLFLMTPSAENAQGPGQQITLKDASGTVLSDVIVGQTRQGGGGGGAGGQYLKKADADTVYLVDGDFQFLNAAPAEWLRREILDVKADAIASVTSTTGKGGQAAFRLVRPEKGQMAEMTPIPQGRTADPAKIEQVFDALGPLTLDDVRAADAGSPAAPGDGARLVYQLYDGRRITLFPGQDGDGNPILRITADEAIPPTAPAEADAAAGQVDQSAASDAAPDGDKADGPPAAAALTAEQLNARWAPWVFVVKQWQMDSLITEVESLLEAAATDQ